MALPFLFLATCAFVGGVAAWGICSKQRVFEMPVIVAAFSIAWLIPQGLTAERRDFGTTFQDEFFWAYVLSCLVALTCGFYSGKRAEYQRSSILYRTAPIYSYNRLILCAAGLVVVGSLALTLMSRAAATQDLGSQWTGVATAYALLANTRTFGVCLAALLFARTGRILPLVIAVIGVLVALPMINSGVKRSVMFETVVTTAGAYYLARHTFPPRMAVVALVIFGTVLLHQVGAVREYTKRTNSTVAEAVWAGVMFEKFEYFDLDKAFEVEQAKFDIRYINKTMKIEYGADYWNQLTHQYVPAFIVGRNFKESLKFETLRTKAKKGDVSLLFSKGATRTGFSDTFRSFWFFGAFFFMLMGYVSGRLYLMSWRGHIASQALYLITMSEYLVAITHGTAIFIASLPFTLGTMMIALWASKKQRPRSSLHKATAPIDIPLGSQGSYRH